MKLKDKLIEEELKKANIFGLIPLYEINEETKTEQMIGVWDLTKITNTCVYTESNIEKLMRFLQ